MKKALSLGVSILLVLIFSCSGIVGAVEFDIPAKSAILVDSQTGQVLYEKNPHSKLPPASITKIMTLLLALEAIERGEVSLDDTVTISQRAESMGGSQIYLSTRDRLTLENLLKSVAIASANDACVAIAEYIGGTVENFVRLMNQRAEELGMKNTNFVNSTGLPAENHYSTAYDIALMSRELIKFDQFREWATIWHEYIQLNGRKASLTNTNTLVRSYPDLDGIKTGHTDEAGYCLASSAEKNGFRLIAVVLNTESPEIRDEASARLLDYGFRSFERKVVVKEKEIIPDIIVKQGKKKSIDAYTANSLQVTVLKGTSSELRREVFSLEKIAPIKKDEKVGELIIYQNGKELGKVDLLASEDVEKANIFVRFIRWLWSLIQNLINSVRK